MGKSEIIATIVLFNLFFILFLIGIILFIKQYKLKKKEHNDILNFREKEHQKELLSNQLEIQNQTMQYIGREIHDNIGQKLTLASICAQKLAFENEAPQINEDIESISDIINQALVELRQLSKTLTNDTIEIHTLQELLKEECKKVNKLKKCSISFKGDEAIVLDSYQVKSILYRITQEFLQNSIKHSNCSKIKVLLQKRDHFMQLKLQDNGSGFDIHKIKSNGIGLGNMQKRATLLGGTFNLESNSSIGTIVTIEIPL